MIIHGLSVDDVDVASRANGEFQVAALPGAVQDAGDGQPEQGHLQGPGACAGASQAAIDKEKITEEVYGDNGTVSTQIYPAGELPEGMATDTPTLRPDSCSAKPVEARRTRPSTSAYSSDDPRNQPGGRARADRAPGGRAQRHRRGASRSPRSSTCRNHKDQAPDILLSTVNPDAAHPDTWARIFMNTDGRPQLAAVLGARRRRSDGRRPRTRPTRRPSMHDAYGKAGDLFVASGCFVTASPTSRRSWSPRRATATSSTSCRPCSRSASRT